MTVPMQLTAIIQGRSRDDPDHILFAKKTTLLGQNKEIIVNEYIVPVAKDGKSYNRWGMVRVLDRPIDQETGKPTFKIQDMTTTRLLTTQELEQLTDKMENWLQPRRTRRTYKNTGIATFRKG